MINIKERFIASEEIENSYKSISNARENARAVQNRFLLKIGNWRVTVEKLSQVDSTIQGTDIGTELALLTQNQILSNVAFSIVGQKIFPGKTCRTSSKKSHKTIFGHLL